MEWLPDIGNVVAAAFIAAIIEAMKAAGMPVRYADLANVVLSGLWAALAVAIKTWPGAEPFAVAIVQFIYALLGAWGFYKFAVKPIVNKRWNR